MTLQRMNAGSRYALLLLLFFLISYIIPLGVRDLFVPDETRYAEIPREMVAGGDWVVSHLNGLRYFEKPVLGYWVHAAAQLLFGESNFAVRFPSAMAVGLSALLIFMLVYRVRRKDSDGDDFSPTLAALIFLSCIEVFGVGSTATLDSLFSLFLTATISAFYFATEAPPGSAKERYFLLLAGLTCGLAFLTKGFLALAVPVLALAPYLIWQGRYFDLFRMSWLPIVTAFMVALPWGIWIHLREPDFWRFFFWNEHIRRFMADNAQHKESFWFFFVMAPAMFIPWTFFVPAAVPEIRQRLKDQSPRGRLMRLSVCWLVLPFVFFSVSNGKLLTYILPCFPPFAILMVYGLIYAHEKKWSKKTFQWGIVINAMFFSLILLTFLYMEFIGFNEVRPYKQSWKAIMVVNSLVFLILFCFFAFRNRKGTVKTLFLGLSMLFFFFIAPFVIPDPTTESKSPGPLLERHRQDIGLDDVIISDEDTIHAVCWYFKRRDVYLLGGRGELRYGLDFKDAEGRGIDEESAVDLINRNRGKTVLIARAKRLLRGRWRDRFPKPDFEDDSGPSGYTFRRY